MKSGTRRAGYAALKFFHVETKLNAMFGLVLIACAVSGAIGLYGVREVFAENGSPEVPGIQSLYEIGKSMAIIDAAENALLAAEIDEKKRRSIHSRFEEAGRQIDVSRQAYEKSPRSPKEEHVWTNFIRALDRWSADHEAFVRLAGVHEKSGTPETYRSMSAQAIEINPASLSKAVSALDAAMKVNLERVKETSKMDGSATAVFRENVGFSVIVVVSAMAMILLGAGLARRPRRCANRLPLAIGSYPPAFSPVPQAKREQKLQQDSTD